MKCQAGDSCDNEPCHDPAMKSMWFGTICRFHWCVFRYERGDSITVLDAYDFTMEEVKEEADTLR